MERVELEPGCTGAAGVFDGGLVVAESAGERAGSLLDLGEPSAALGSPLGLTTMRHRGRDDRDDQSTMRVSALLDVHPDPVAES